MSMNRPRLLHLIPLAVLALGAGLATAAPASAAAAATTSYTTPTGAPADPHRKPPRLSVQVG